MKKNIENGEMRQEMGFPLGGRFGKLACVGIFILSNGHGQF
jgi:hypothetical protein